MIKIEPKLAGKVLVGNPYFPVYIRRAFYLKRYFIQKLSVKLQDRMRNKTLKRDIIQITFRKSDEEYCCVVSQKDPKSVLAGVTQHIIIMK